MPVSATCGLVALHKAQIVAGGPLVLGPGGALQCTGEPGEGFLQQRKLNGLDEIFFSIEFVLLASSGSIRAEQWPFMDSSLFLSFCTHWSGGQVQRKSLDTRRRMFFALVLSRELWVGKDDRGAHSRPSRMISGYVQIILVTGSLVSLLRWGSGAPRYHFLLALYRRRLPLPCWSESATCCANIPRQTGNMAWRDLRP